MTIGSVVTYTVDTVNALLVITEAKYNINRPRKRGTYAMIT